MISIKIFVFTVALIALNSFASDDYRKYTVFDNKVTAVFPGEPTLQGFSLEDINPETLKELMPDNYKKKFSQLSQKQVDELVQEIVKKIKSETALIYIDQQNKRSYVASLLPSNLEHKNYMWSGMKSLLDDIHKNEVAQENRKIVSFLSTLDGKNDTYITVFTSVGLVEGEKVYISKKVIWHKDYRSSWSVTYVNPADKNIFDRYEKNFNIIK